MGDRWEGLGDVEEQNGGMFVPSPGVLDFLDKVEDGVGGIATWAATEMGGREQVVLFSSTHVLSFGTALLSLPRPLSPSSQTTTPPPLTTIANLKPTTHAPSEVQKAPSKRSNQDSRVPVPEHSQS